MRPVNGRLIWFRLLLLVALIFLLLFMLLLLLLLFMLLRDRERKRRRRFCWFCCVGPLFPKRALMELERRALTELERRALTELERLTGVVLLFLKLLRFKRCRLRLRDLCCCCWLLLIVLLACNPPRRILRRGLRTTPNRSCTVPVLKLFWTCIRFLERDLLRERERLLPCLNRLGASFSLRTTHTNYYFR